jgi:glutaredoxin
LSKILINISLALVLSLLVIALSGMTEHPQFRSVIPKTDIEVFVRKGCPHCEAAKVFLDKLKEKKPELQILYHDMGQDSQALPRLTKLAVKHGVKHLGVPTFYLRGELIVGYNSHETTGKQILELLERPPPGTTSRDSKDTCPLQSTTSCNTPKVSHPVDTHSINIPWLGSYSLDDIGLPLFTIFLGLLDGFNPCAMWVLLFLLSLLATLRDRRKMFLIAGTFVIVSGLVFPVNWIFPNDSNCAGISGTHYRRNQYKRFRGFSSGHFSHDSRVSQTRHLYQSAASDPGRKFICGFVGNRHSGHHGQFY